MTVCWEKLWTDRQADIYKHADRHGNRQTDVQMRAKPQYLLLKAEFEKVIKVINLSVNLKSKVTQNLVITGPITATHEYFPSRLIILLIVPNMTYHSKR